MSVAAQAGRLGGRPLSPVWLQRLRRGAVPYLFVLPNLAIFTYFVIYPAINNFIDSLYDSQNGRTFTYVGTANFSRLLSSSEFWAAARATLTFAVCFVALTTALAIGVAVLLNQHLRGRAFFRAVAFMPYLLSPVVVGLIWGWMFDRRAGIINLILHWLGAPGVGWLVEPRIALGVVVFVGLWLTTGFYSLIILAGLQAIDPSLYEAAQVDGAGPFQRFWRVTLPLLRPATTVVVILSLIHGFQAFDFIYTLTGGGPVGATTLMVQYIYDHAFIQPISYGFASASSVLLFGSVFGLTLISFWLSRREEAG